MVDHAAASGAAGITARDLQSPRAQFGLRDGLDHVRAALQGCGLRATFAVPYVELRCVSNATGDRTRAAFAIPAACTRVQTAVATLLEQDSLALVAAPRPRPR